MFHREYIFEFGPFFIAIVSLLEGTERPLIQRHIYIYIYIWEYFFIESTENCYPFDVYPFSGLLLATLALSQVCNDASECCRQRRLKRAKRAVCFRASSSVVWLVCDMNAPWLNRQGGGYEIGICGVPCCYAWHWVSSYRGRRDASMSLFVFLSKLTVVLVSLGVLDHCWCGSEVLTEDHDQTSERYHSAWPVCTSCIYTVAFHASLAPQGCWLNAGAAVCRFLVGIAQDSPWNEISMEVKDLLLQRLPTKSDLMDSLFKESGYFWYSTPQRLGPTLPLSSAII